MATPLPDVISFLRTSGDTDGLRRTFLDQGEVTFEFGNDVSQREKAFAMLAFEMWDDLIDFPISLAGSDDYVNIVFSYTEDLANHVAGVNRDSLFFISDHRTEVLISRDEFDTLEFGGFEFQVYLHEIGHALGLTHPGPYNADADRDDLQYGTDNIYPEDNQQFTLMSYFGRHNGADNYVANSASSPLLHDILAIQSIYGSGAARTGDTTYGFNSNTARSFNGFALDPYDFESSFFATSISPQFAIWDTGGIDTIDASLWPEENLTIVQGDTFIDRTGFVDQIIDLRPGTFSSIGFSGLNDVNAIHEPLVNNIAIAFGVIIENAIGGDGNDVLFGNDVSNRLIGNRGKDQILGFDGDDFLDGGAGSDELLGGDDRDELRGGGGADVLVGGSGDDILEGGSGGGIGEGDRLDGGEDFDTASYANASFGIVFDPSTNPGSGDIAHDTFFSIEAFELTNFNDTFHAGSGSFFHAINDDQIIDGGGGNDQLFGYDGNDTLIGGFGNDTLDGGKGHDILRAGRVNDSAMGTDLDTMTGGEGNDTYFVNSTNDVVVEVAGNLALNGSDVVRSIVSYTLSNGVEELWLEGSALNGTGNNGTNVIRGNGLANTLDGGGIQDVDTLIGGGGNDTYVVNHINDIVDESSGLASDIDTVRSSSTFSLNNAATIRGQVENLTLTGGVAINGTGNGLANILLGNAESNILSGFGNHDTLDGKGGADVMFGGTGNDTYVIDNAGDRVDETTGGASDVDTVLSSVSFSLFNQVQSQGLVENITLTGSANINATGDFLNNVLTGNSGNNTLNGGSGNDTLLGGDGNDVLDGGTGVNTLDGQDGVDTATFANSAAGVFAVLGQNGADGGVIFGSDTLRSIENLIGSSFGDVLAGNEQKNAIEGRNGNDRLLDSLGDDTYDGGNGFDVLEFGSAASAVNVNMQNGTVSHAGTQEFDKFISIESVTGSQFSDVFTTSSQNDTFSGAGGNDSYLFVGANAGNDQFIDASGHDNVTFNFNDINSIRRVGNDLVADLTGGDFTVVNHFAGSAIETARDAATGRQVTLAVGLTGGDLPGIIAGSDQDETLDGRGGDDLLYGNRGRDTLLGGDGDDLLDGGKGRDVLVGGQGADTLIGGKAADTFVFAPGAGHDVIRDFGDGHDRIDLTAFRTTFRALDDNRDGELDRGEGDGQLSVTRDHGDTLLTFAGGSIRIEGVTHLGANDFLL